MRQQLQIDDAGHFEVLAEIISHPLNLDDIPVNSPVEDTATIARTICKRIKDDVIGPADPNNQDSGMMSMSRWVQDTIGESDVVFLHSARQPQDIIFRSL